MSFLVSSRRHFQDEFWANNICRFTEDHDCLPSEHINARYAFNRTFGPLHLDHPLLRDVNLYGYRNALADLEEELLNLRPHMYERPLFRRIRMIPRISRLSTFVDAPVQVIGAPVQVVGQQPMLVQAGQPAAIMAPPGDSQVTGSQVQATQVQPTQVQASSYQQGSSQHSAKAPSGMASQFVSQFPVPGRQSGTSDRQSTTTNRAQPTEVNPTERGSSRSTATIVKPSTRPAPSQSKGFPGQSQSKSSSGHSQSRTSAGQTGYKSSSGQSGYKSSSGESGYKGSSGQSGYQSSSGQSGFQSSSGQNGYKSSSGQSGYKSSSGQSQSSKSYLGFSALATKVNDDRFPTEGVPLEGISKIPNPKYSKPDHNIPDHWYYCTIVRNNTAKGMGTMRSEAQEKAKKKMNEKGLQDDRSRKSAVDRAIQAKTLQFISDGSRGKLYLLKPSYEHILGAAISMGVQDGRRWTLFGIGEKSIKGHYLLLALKI